MLEKALGLLAIAQKGGNLEIGEEPVGTAAHGGKARLIILASDAADHTQRRARSYGSLHETPIVTLETDKQTLGSVFGRSSVAMATLTDVFLAKAFLERLEDRERYAQQLVAVTEKAAVMAKRKREKPRRSRKKGTR